MLLKVILMVIVPVLLKCLTSTCVVSFIPSCHHSNKHCCCTAAALNIVSCSHKSWSLLALIVMGTMWISTRLCNHTVWLVPRIAGGCLAPGAKANTSRTGHLINPGLYKRRETKRILREQACCVSLHTFWKNLESEEKLFIFDWRVFSTSVPVTDTSILIHAQRSSYPSFKNNQAISPGTYIPIKTLPVGRFKTMYTYLF